MLNKIIEFSIGNKLIVFIAVIALVAYGSYELNKLPIDAVPDITNNQVQIITVAPALGATDIERLITFPIEQANKNLPELIEMRSFSRFGLSLITLVFEDETDIYWARQQVGERLQQVQNELSNGFGTPILAPVTTGLGEIYQYVVRPKKGFEDRYDATELRTIQDWYVRRQLLGIPGVADVSSFGGYLKQYEIAVVPEVLLANKISIQEVFSALESNNENTGGAYIEKNETALFIRSEGLVGSIEDIENIVVKNLPNGTPLLIKNVAEVKIGHATRFGAMTYNGEREVAGAVVMMLKYANSNEVIQNIKKRITEIQKTLPEGVVIEPFLDRTKMVNNSISTVSKNLMEGALIVVFVLVLFLGNLRAGIIVATVIPLAMLFAIIMMNLFGVSGNLMSLGALDFGLIVDGAVIIVESVLHKLNHSKSFASIDKLSQKQIDDEVKSSASQMMNSAVFGQIIILIVYLPILSLQGIEGKMFKPMAQTVAFALIGALLLSLTYVPMISALVLSKKIKHNPSFSDRMMAKVERFYQQYLLKALRIEKGVLLFVVLLFAGSTFLLTRLGGEFIPSLPEGDFAVETRVLPGSNLQTSIDAVNQSSKILLEKFPEIEKIVGKTGSSEIPTDPMPMDASDIIIILKDKSEWTSASTYEELEALMTKELEAVPGVSFGFQYPVAMRFNELISGARQDVVIKIFGENLDTLARYAQKIGLLCNSVDGSTGLYVEPITGMPQMVIRYNRKAMARYGVNIADINRVIKTAFAGESTGFVYEGERRFELVVRLNEQNRNGLSDLENLLIPIPNGTQIPLYLIAQIAIEEGPNQIQRENSQRRIIVGFNVRGRDIQSAVQELQEKVDKEFKLPAGYSIHYGGAFENLEKAKNRLAVAVPVSLVMIFLLLYFAFKSVKQGLIIFTAIPLSAIGGIIALYLRDIPFSVSAGIGFIALFGVAVLNGIVLIAEFNRLKKSGYNNLRRIVVIGTKIRLRPVLMTAFVASLGFLPMALSTGEGAEVQRPLATVVIGGLMIATLLTLFVLPILYVMFHQNQKLNLSNQGLPMVALLFGILFSQSTNAQRTINIHDAISFALQNNFQIENQQLQIEWQEKMKKTAFDLLQTTVIGQFGQYNSIFMDNQIGLSQNLSFPLVYARKKALHDELFQRSTIHLDLKTAETERAVKQLFYTYLFLREKQTLLERSDSLFAEFLTKATFRFEQGETNILEKSTAENQRGQLGSQLLQLINDKELVLLRFQLTLNADSVYVPFENFTKLNGLFTLDTTSIKNHPQLELLQQNKKIAEKQLSIQQAGWLPELSLSYYNTSIQGMGSDDLFYPKSERFQYAQVGLGIPIFYKAQAAKTSAGKVEILIAENEMNYGLDLFKTEFDVLMKNQTMLVQNIDNYEALILPNATVVIQTANAQFESGEISYLEWNILINNAIEIQSNYLDLINQWNQNNIQLEFLFYQN
jgi:cobalt-zinc-cadmium resistance protein CzcA